MATSSLAAEVLVFRLGYLQRRAHTLHSDATDRFLRAKLRALSTQVRQISATLGATPGAMSRVIASELTEGVILALQQLEQDARRRPSRAVIDDGHVDRG